MLLSRHVEREESLLAPYSAWIALCFPSLRFTVSVFLSLCVALSSGLGLGVYIGLGFRALSFSLLDFVLLEGLQALEPYRPLVS